MLSRGLSKISKKTWTQPHFFFFENPSAIFKMSFKLW